MVTYYPFGLGIPPPVVQLLLMFLIAGVHWGVTNNNNTTAAAAAATAEAEANNNNDSISSGGKWVNGGDVSVLYKWCGEQEADGEKGFVECREEAMAELLKGDHMEGTAVLAWRIAQVEGITARAQCGDRLSWPDCTDCIAWAGKQIMMACPHSARARLFADGCFVSYDSTPPLEPGPKPPKPPKPPQPPHPPKPPPIPGGGGVFHFTAHTVALILGAVAVVLLLLVSCLCLKSHSRRCDD